MPIYYLIFQESNKNFWYWFLRIMSSNEIIWFLQIKVDRVKIGPILCFVFARNLFSHQNPSFFLTLLLLSLISQLHPELHIGTWTLNFFWVKLFFHHWDIHFLMISCFKEWFFPCLYEHYIRRPVRRKETNYFFGLIKVKQKWLSRPT